MAFPKVLKAANVASLIVIAAGDTANDGGFLISEAALNSLEATFSNADNNSANATTEITSLTNQLTEANTRLTSANTRIGNLVTEVADLKKGPAHSFSVTTAAGDPEAGKKAGKEKYRTTYDDEAERYAALNKSEI